MAKIKKKTTKKRKIKKRKVTAKKKPTVKKPEAETRVKKEEKYFEAVGRRKTAVARVRLFGRGGKEFLVNGKPYQGYFTILELKQIAESSLEKMNCLDRFRVLVKVKGGGIRAQAEAIRLATARALIKFNPNFRKRLRKVGFLTRDSRMRERKKFGLKRARRAPQWKKR